MSSGTSTDVAEQPFFTKRKAKDKRHFVLPLSCDWFWEHVVSQQVQGTFMNQKLRQERSIWGIRIIGNSFLCFLLLPFLCVCSQFGSRGCVWLASASGASIHCCTLLSSGAAADGPGGRAGRSHPRFTAFALWTSLLWQENPWPYKYSFPSNSQHTWKACTSWNRPILKCTSYTLHFTVGERIFFLLDQWVSLALYDYGRWNKRIIWKDKLPSLGREVTW